MADQELKKLMPVTLIPSRKRQYTKLRGLACCWWCRAAARPSAGLSDSLLGSGTREHRDRHLHGGCRRRHERRFATLFGPELVDKLTFCTINSLSTTIIHRHTTVKKRESFKLVTNDGQLFDVMRELMIRTGIGYPIDLQVKDARTHISFAKT